MNPDFFLLKPESYLTTSLTDKLAVEFNIEIVSKQPQNSCLTKWFNKLEPSGANKRPDLQ